jgi:enoyl-CoA hydratase/carnithine racemase
MSEHINISTDGGVQIIRMNRPDKKNALNRDMYRAMADALVEGDKNDDIRCHLFLGVPGAFTAGNDIADFMLAAQGGAGIGAEVQAFLRAIITVTKPLLAGVDGMAIGIGSTMLLHCDIVYASTSARFKTPFLDLGLLPEAGSTLVAPRAMGYKAAFALLAMGEQLDPNGAKDAGLVSVVVDSGEFEEQAIAAARRVAARPPEAMALTRRLMRGNRDEIVARMEEESGHFAERLKSTEAQNAFMAFMSRGK